jgi:hypothetical protein
MKKAYMFITSSGYDPDRGHAINDPYLGDIPTLGACMPNIRRLVVPGDHIFTVSGSVPGAPQYVVGGFEVVEKIHAKEAYVRFPKLRVHLDKKGEKIGNIIVDSDGRQNALDTHDGFEQRIDNYIVGRDPIVLTHSKEIMRGRLETLDVLRNLFGKDGAAPIEAMGRWHRLNEDQINLLRRWLIAIKRDS